MQFSVARESLLKPLQMISGVVERRQTLPILSNVLVSLDNSELSLTGTDLEVELAGKIKVDKANSGGEITVPARKLFDICKSLPDNSLIEFIINENKCLVNSGRSKFSLLTLPATEFPKVVEEQETLSFKLSQARLKDLIEATSFAMAQQDVRYYLNGMLFEIANQTVKLVATDGHRLAMSELALEGLESDRQIILPRKGIIEMSRLLSDGNGDITLSLGQNQIRASMPEYTFTSKLVDGNFPDYKRVLPKGGNKVVTGNRQELKNAFSRVSILSNEKYKGVRVMLSPGELRVLANNPEQEEAEEVVVVDYDGDPLEIGFNVTYVIDVLNTLQSDDVKITLSDANSSALLESLSDNVPESLYVVMPMRL